MPDMTTLILEKIDRLADKIDAFSGDTRNRIEELKEDFLRRLQDLERRIVELEQSKRFAVGLLSSPIVSKIVLGAVGALVYLSGHLDILSRVLDFFR